ncbi:MAG: zf-HC2 domain-containing protein [Acidocella sp.]|nr:zf-HC2 domain-containing protein [Acidocella sp.]
MSCPDYSERLNAMLDGELSPSDLVVVAVHLASCPECLQHVSELAELRVCLQRAIPEEEVSPEFYDKIAGMLDSEPVGAAGETKVITFKAPSKRQHLVWLAAGAAIAAMLSITFMPRHDETRDLMSVHDAALRGNISQNVAVNSGSAVAGFYLASARSDIVAGHPAQVLAYTRSGQTITLCVWSANGEPAHGVRNAVYKGMAISYWNDGKQEYWAATAGPAATLDEFVSAIGQT